MTGSADDQMRAQLHQLWTANFLNLRRATEEARVQGRSRLDVGLEVLGVTFDAQEEFHPYARDCLLSISRSPCFVLHFWTFAPAETVERLRTTKLVPAGIIVRGHNENPLRRNVAWDPRKPWFDVLLDRTSGLDQAAGHWYWAHGLFQIASESLASTRSGATIIRSAERFAISPDPTTTIRRQR